jgi:hypothetical protein
MGATIEPPLAVDAAAASACVKGHFRGIFMKRVAYADAGAAYWVGAWRTFREMTPEFLHDDHTARLASRTRRSRYNILAAMSGLGQGERRCHFARSFIAGKRRSE